VQPIRVLIADDHGEVLDDIREALQPEFVVVAAVRDGCALVLAANQLKPDIIVADISMPQMDGIEATRVIIQKDPASKVIALTIHNDLEMVSLAFGAGVQGYVLKMRASQELSQALHTVLQGQRYLSPSLRRPS